LITWYFENNQIKQDRFGVLKFDRLDYKDVGRYECFAENEFGSDSKEFHINIPLHVNTPKPTDLNMETIQESHSTSSNNYEYNYVDNDQYPSLLAYSSTTKILTTAKVYNVYSTDAHHHSAKQSSSSTSSIFMRTFERPTFERPPISTSAINDFNFTTQIYAFATSPINARSSSIKFKTDSIHTIAEAPYEIEERENDFEDLPEFQPLVRIKILSNPVRDHVENGTVKLQCLSSNLNQFNQLIAFF
jgi:hypothetical protein